MFYDKIDKIRDLFAFATAKVELTMAIYNKNANMTHHILARNKKKKEVQSP